MKLQMFLINLAVTLSVVTIAMFYLRQTTRRVINELCHSDSGAEFWLRSADILAYSGSLMLVLMFGKFHLNDWVEVIRITLTLTLAGLFFTVMFVARNVWKTVVPAKPALRSE